MGNANNTGPNFIPETPDLEEALSIRLKMHSLESRLSGMLQGPPPNQAVRTTARRYFSPATRAKLSAASKARWAKTRRTGGAAPAKRKGQLTPAGRRKLSQLMKARWAAARPRARIAQKGAARKKGRLTPAGRKRLSQLMKARWAARRKAAARR